MKLGLILPTFAERADAAFETAARAEAAGLDGVFCYDHVWPMGRPDRPALAPFPVLGALAARTSRLALGTLVARIGLVPEAVLVSQLVTLDQVSGGRAVAGLGTGDRLSAAENLAYGVPFAPAAERRAALDRVAATLRRRGLCVWVGGRATTAEVGRREGAAVNLWAATPAEVAQQAQAGEVTWAGPPPEGGGAQLRPFLAALADAGATWAVLAPGTDPGTLAGAAP